MGKRASTGNGSQAHPMYSALAPLQLVAAMQFDLLCVPLEALHEISRVLAPWAARSSGPLSARQFAATPLASEPLRPALHLVSDVPEEGRGIVHGLELGGEVHEPKRTLSVVRIETLSANG